MPAIATSWAMLFASSSLFNMYYTYENLLNKKDPKALSVLGEAHALIAGFKGVSTWYGEHFGESLKQACGGHGYL